MLGRVPSLPVIQSLKCGSQPRLLTEVDVGWVWEAGDWPGSGCPSARLAGSLSPPPGPGNKKEKAVPELRWTTGERLGPRPPLGRKDRPPLWGQKRQLAPPPAWHFTQMETQLASMVPEGGLRAPLGAGTHPAESTLLSPQRLSGQM